MSKTALITGIRGQDGAYLARLLLEKGYKVFGGDRRSSAGSTWRLDELGIRNDIEMVYFDLMEQTSMMKALSSAKPDEIYNLAAQSFVGASFDQPILTAEVDAMGVLRLLESVRVVNADARFYQASSSELFGKVDQVPQTEDTPFNPRNPYAISKLFAHHMVATYRESYNMYCCSGILFNHESPLREESFVSRKIARFAAERMLGRSGVLELGNLDAKRDWGYAPEFAEGIWLMLQQSQPQDFILATNETHSIREFTEIALGIAGIKVKWKGSGISEVGMDDVLGEPVVKVNPKFYRPLDFSLSQGDYSRAVAGLGWKPRTRFAQLIEILIEAEKKRIGG